MDILWRLLVLVILFPCTLLADSKPVLATHGMVVTEQQLASQVGLDILKQGGNAVDAAVATGYALAVVDPCCGNIGGGGFMLIHFANGKDVFLNFRERAPLTATSNMYLDSKGEVIPNASVIGYKAVATPGTVLGLDSALQKYGTMSRLQVMMPAIKLALNGFILSPYDVKLLTAKTELFKSQPNVAAIFLKDGKPYQVGDRLVQTDLAETLNSIARLGPDYFYKGYPAQAIVIASHDNGGILSLLDFEKYRVEELTPVHCSYRGYDIISAPPPSSGGVTLCEMLNILDYYPLNTLGYHSPLSAHYIIEAMRRGFYDRNNNLGDPDFVKNPIAILISKQYAANVRRQIHNFKATSSTELISMLPKEKEKTNTTHYSVVDKDGNAVAVTYTIDNFFGAGVIAGRTGFFLNDEMDDFTAKPNAPNKFGLVQGVANAIAPGKRPLSSMTPTIITKDKDLFMVLGSPGGPRIITSVLQTILNVVDYNLNIQEAVNAPRFHQQWLPDWVETEPNIFSSETENTLKLMGYQLKPISTWGAVEAIEIDPVTKILYGANDIRRPNGKAMGY